MYKVKLLCGYTAYKALWSETMMIGGLGICDECNKFAPEGYLVPVLNHYQCPKCHEDWRERAVYYPEDVWSEKRYEQYYESHIPLSYV